MAEDAEQLNPNIERAVAEGQLMESTAKNIHTLLAGARVRSLADHPNRTARSHTTGRKTIANPLPTNQRRSGTIVPLETGTNSSSNGDELVRCERRIGGVGNQFQKVRRLG